MHKYDEGLIVAARELVRGVPHLISNLANVASLIFNSVDDISWAGFYILQGNKLVLGPFQGPLACTRIAYGRGVCGTAWKERRTIVVPDVEQFPGHIACSAASRSEIVVPVFRDGEVVAVLDIDSAELNTFDETDAENLNKMVTFL